MIRRCNLRTTHRTYRQNVFNFPHAITMESEAYLRKSPRSAGDNFRVSCFGEKYNHEEVKNY